ncbi:succinate dehydrogenase/fumarate reductase iron-sulfur subunit [candidate division GN15 bacterium]|nr:succinate dehydrogenase/fumarate reductase iron-sulfur subunit [candidate division GN15 bacterium]
MNLTLHVWRQKNAQDKGRMETYEARDISEHMSFLEMLDVVNEQLMEKDIEPIHFDHDCREGICGMCSMVINGIAHGPERSTTVCQLHMRHFKDGDKIYIEPWRSRAFPVIRDLVVNRQAFERVIQAGGYVSVNTGGAPDANAIPIAKQEADRAMDAAACIGCGACVAACKNASAMLFVAAKMGHLASLPQGRVEAERRAERMVAQMDAEGFGNCTNYFECEAVCPKNISVDFIAQMNREFMKSSWRRKRK